ncbi:hypothetical protein CMV_027766, partial [Castanea mollissima]
IGVREGFELKDF